MGGAPSHPGRVDLFSDSDGCSTIDTYYDAVSVGAELFIYDSSYWMFPPPYSSMSNPDYLNIRTLDNATNLRNAMFSQVKQVQSMEIPNIGKIAGYAQDLPGSNIVIDSKASPMVWVHELGHNLGLPHRNDYTNNLMFETNPGTELNRTERSAFER